jgi:hypothetical protein
LRSGNKVRADFRLLAFSGWPPPARQASLPLRAGGCGIHEAPRTPGEPP